MSVLYRKKCTKRQNLTAGNQIFGKAPCSNVQRGLRLRLRESHGLEVPSSWYDVEMIVKLVKTCSYRISAALWVYWNSVDSQSGRQLHSEADTSVIAFKNPWVSVALGAKSEKNSYEICTILENSFLMKNLQNICLLQPASSLKGLFSTREIPAGGSGWGTNVEFFMIFITMADTETLIVPFPFHIQTGSLCLNTWGRKLNY